MCPVLSAYLSSATIPQATISSVRFTIYDFTVYYECFAVNFLPDFRAKFNFNCFRRFFGGSSDIFIVHYREMLKILYIQKASRLDIFMRDVTRHTDRQNE
jgi:hypothetical protein